MVKDRPKNNFAVCLPPLPTLSREGRGFLDRLSVAIEARAILLRIQAALACEMPAQAGLPVCYPCASAMRGRVSKAACRGRRDEKVSWVRPGAGGRAGILHLARLGSRRSRRRAWRTPRRRQICYARPSDGRSGLAGSRSSAGRSTPSSSMSRTGSPGVRRAGGGFCDHESITNRATIRVGDVM